MHCRLETFKTNTDTNPITTKHQRQSDVVTGFLKFKRLINANQIISKSDERKSESNNAHLIIIAYDKMHLIITESDKCTSDYY